MCVCMCVYVCTAKLHGAGYLAGCYGTLMIHPKPPKPLSLMPEAMGQNTSSILSPSNFLPSTNIQIQRSEDIRFPFFCHLENSSLQ
ncbi:unnamed protein product [Onchocerca flexuosa]|uniref:Secreted protein n=1 Tax=Onchocerca flexuosa TaxID=387005 RepID=A0A183I4H7_9BILA|nr:unnamed protein product [Onchocerca flexuosa]